MSAVPAPAAVAGVEVRREVVPPWPFRLPRGGMDGVLRRHGQVLERLLHVDGEPAVVRVAQPSATRVVLGARAAREDLAEEAIARMRFALGVDDDLRPFHDRFRDDPLIGASVRRRPWLRIRRRPEPFEALAWAVTEQLIETVRAFAIQRRIVRALGPTALGWDGATVLRDVPSPAAIAGCAPALLESFDLAASRSLALCRAAREVARGRVDLRDPDHERGWRRLTAIPGIGQWTVDVLALHGQGRLDVIPAGDLGYLKWIGRVQSGGDPKAVGEEADVRALFARYDGWAGLAGAHALVDASPAANVSAGPQIPPPGRNSLVSAVGSAGRSSRSLSSIQRP
ncbi:DNA-3-methyladenine glycosylase [Conexibacter sp. SYSU D00693]|uniref:DNA-3-methyladenine glycosylase family protein n=1 Tax=Conexibacter sp. SYSU D00693 TaxID=2812560 RepID=UPI00196AC0F7|nr:DNA-3-methyladenine glycosylase 2 family protein [Conexibacter sp. SYSU D00693]